MSTSINAWIMIGIHQSERRNKMRRNAVRGIAVLAVTVGAMLTAGSVSAAPAGSPREPAEPAAKVSPERGFFEVYRGHHIMGWGHGDAACAYIDGMQLVLYPTDGGRFGSALQAYQQERGLRAITKASVRVLGKLNMAPPADPVPHCPVFAVPRKAG